MLKYEDSALMFSDGTFASALRESDPCWRDMDSLWLDSARKECDYTSNYTIETFGLSGV